MKDEMGITAFGKRKKLEIAIAELRRPSSLSSGQSMRHIAQANITGHSHEQSVSTGYSLNSPISSAFTTQGASIISVETPLHSGEMTFTPASSEFGAFTISDKVIIVFMSSISFLMYYRRNREALPLQQVMA
jgi:hypothetical protein